MHKTVFLLCLLVVCGGLSQAAVIDIPDVSVGGTTYRAFQDPLTGFTWLDLDNFFFTTTTYNSLVATLATTGMHLATLTELQALQASMPAVPANFLSDAQIVGGNYPLSPHATGSRGIIWGIYEDGDPSDGVGYSWKYDTDVSWNTSANAILRTDIFPDSNATARDLGAWVVGNAGPAEVPEPGTVGMMLTGLAAVLAGLKRK